MYRNLRDGSRGFFTSMKCRVKGGLRRRTRNSLAFLLLMIAGHVGTASAEYDPTIGGWTEVIACHTSTWDVCPIYHPEFYWGGSGPNLVYTSPSGWWTYADPGLSAKDCSQWVNGGIVGGATYEEGQPSIPQGVDVRITTTWWDFENTDFSTTCGHQHATTYVWGWRYLGNSWTFEFVDAHSRTSYLDVDEGICRFQAEGNPEYPPPYDSFAYGPETIQIINSPYVLLFTKSQANSHYNAGCGEFECFHRVRVGISYEGGPGINKGKPVLPPPTDEFTQEPRHNEDSGPNVVASRGGGLTQRPGSPNPTYFETVASYADQAQREQASKQTLEDQLEIDKTLACDLSYEQTAAAMTVYSKGMDTGDFPPLKMASYGDYMDDCTEQPAEVQKCQVFEYMGNHLTECKAARDEYNRSLQR